MVIFLFCAILWRLSYSCSLGEDYRTQMLRIFEKKKPHFINILNSTLSKHNISSIYVVQENTINVFIYSLRCGDVNTLDSLIEIWNEAYAHISNESVYKYYYLPGHGSITTLPLNPPSKMWVDGSGIEQVLYSSQFLFLMSLAINEIVGIYPKTSRTKNMNLLIENYAPVVYDTYRRWVFADRGNHRGRWGVKGWKCSDGVYNHKEFIQKKGDKALGDRHIYCNAICDFDLWILAGSAEMVSTFLIEPSIYPDLDKSNVTLKNWTSYLTMFVSIIQNKRTTYKNLKDFTSEPKLGTNFGLGMWDDKAEYAYSGYYGKTYPTKKDKKAAKNVGWDISHARRFVYVFHSLFRHADVLGFSFPKKSDMEGLANQLLYGVFNKNFSKPLFSNYMDGNNGWFRVGYHPEIKNFGYQPFGMNRAILTGGYGFWRSYVPKDMQKLFSTLIDMAYQTTFVSSESSVKRYAENIGAFEAVGRFGTKSLYFNGKNSSVFCDYGPELSNSRTGAITFWLKRGNITTEGFLYGLYIDSKHRNFMIRTVGGQRLLIEMKTKDGKYVLFKSEESILKDDDWHFIVVNQNGKNLSVYVDSQKIKMSASSPLWIGFLEPSKGCMIGKSFDGFMDEFRVFTRGLEQEEIQELYLQNTIKNKDGLYVHWNFDENRNQDLLSTFHEYYHWTAFSKIDSQYMLSLYASLS